MYFKANKNVKEFEGQEDARHKIENKTKIFISDIKVTSSWLTPQITLSSNPENEWKCVKKVARLKTWGNL